MVQHFAKILGAVDVDPGELVNTAHGALQSYSCFGVYERLDEFVRQFATLLEIPAPASLQKVNITKSRPTANAISPKLREKIVAITELDQDLYLRVKQLVAERISENPPNPPARSNWATYVRPAKKPRTHPALKVRAVRRLHPGPVMTGAVIQFEIEFELHEAVKKLEAGLHIFDDRKRWAFGVNNILLDQPFTDLAPGRYRLMHFVTAELPAGAYTIGFAFADVGGAAQRSLYWSDTELPFQVQRPSDNPGVGYAHCRARVMLHAPPSLSLARSAEGEKQPDKQLAA
jgi:hypothetical protein